MALVAGMGGGWYALGPAAAADAVETATAARGDFVDILSIRGEVKARRTVPITAPRGAGELQIVYLARSGTVVKVGDVVVRFDPSTSERQLAEKRSALREAEAEIARANAEGRITADAARADRVKRQYDVERARLDVSTSEVISRLDAQKASLRLGAAEQQVREAAAKVDASEATARASLVALERRREKALADVRIEEARLGALTVTAPVNGVVAIGVNQRSGAFFQRQEFRTGDRAWAGAPIAQIPEVDSVYLVGRIDESDRGRLQPGLDAEVEIQALGNRPLPAKITLFSALAKLDYSSWPPPRMFDVELDLQSPQAGLRPGMTAAIKIRRERLPQALLIPTRALFPPSGRTGALPSAPASAPAGTPAEVFVRTRGGFERRAVRVLRRGPETSAIAAGLDAGETVAVERPLEIVEP